MSKDALTDKKKAALKGWLDLLSVGLPPEWGLHTLVDDLTQNIEFISLLDANLKKIIDKHPLPRQKWSKSCDANGVGGFSCGMWKLFHTVTIGMAEHRGGLNLIDAEVVDFSTRVFSPADAADTIREYIAHFFGCNECRDHFISQYDQCSFRRCDRLTDDANASTPEDWKQVSLWLWEVHNDVSVRVANQKATRSAKKAQMSPFRKVSVTPLVVKKEDEIQSLWPTIEECLGCFEETGKWNEASVFAFLERTYWAGPDAKADRLLSARNIDRDTSGGSLIWFMVLIAVAIVVSLRQHLKHLNKSPGLRKTIAAASAISNKLTDQVAGKRTEKKN
jgi:Erv1 / Alr family